MSSPQKALFLEAKFGQLTVKPTDIPKPASGELLVKVEVAALNPIDAVIQAAGVFVDKYPAIIGCDGAGTVVDIGDGVTSFAVGDRVLFQGSINPVEKSINGTFAQYATASVKYAAKIPASVSFDAAATMPCCLPTAALVLYNQDQNAQSVRLTAPWAEGGAGKYAGKSVVVLGGSSSVGQYVIQFARLSGFSPIIATASPHNADFLKTLGATHVVDRNLPSEALEAEVSSLAGGKVDLVYDAISEPGTIALGYALTALDGDFVVVSPPGNIGDKEQKKRVHMAMGLLSIPTNYDAGANLLAALPKLLEEGDVKANRTEILPGGLAAVADGIVRLRNKAVSGVKLVVHPQDTL